MKVKHKIISAFTAAIMGISSAAGTLCAIMTPSYAAAAGDPDEYVSSDMFYVSGDESEMRERFRRALGKDVSSATYNDLSRVTSLNLSGLELTTLPKALNYMDNLRSLNLSKNLLTNNSFKDINLRKSHDLSSFDLSDNYLTALPGWCYTISGISTKRYDRNFIDSTNPRSIKVLTNEYSFLKGDEINTDEFKEEILSSIRLNNGDKLPYIFDEGYDDYSTPTISEESWKEFTDKVKDNVVQLSGDNDSLDLTVQLFASGNSDLSTAKVKIYILDEISPNVIKAQLTSLLEECKDLKKENYTENSWNSFESMQKSADSINNYKDADAQMMVNAFNSLTSAKNALVPGVNSDIKKTLNDLSTAGSSRKAEDYTEDSWNTFNDALEALRNISSDNNATLSDANAAIDAFQNAQDDLESTHLYTPATVTRAQFEKILGENRNLNTTGTTRNGNSYTWTFNGRDIDEPADFNPEVLDTSTAESEILKEVGNANDYRVFTVSQTAAFPGKAKLLIDAKQFGDGNAYLYKWDSNAPVLKAAGEIEDGKMSFTLTEGGMYYITRTLKNYQLTSETFKVDNDNKTILVPFANYRTTVREFKNSFQLTEGLQVRDSKGNPASDTSRITGQMRAAVSDNASYSIILAGDANRDGNVNARDASMILRCTAGLEKNVNTEYADADADGKVTARDATLILKTLVSR